MSRLYTVRADRAACDANWLLAGMHEIRGLALPDLLLVLLVIRGARIPVRVSIDRGPHPEGVVA